MQTSSIWPRPELPPTSGLANEQHVELYLGGFLVGNDLINAVMRTKM